MWLQNFQKNPCFHFLEHAWTKSCPQTGDRLTDLFVCLGFSSHSRMIHSYEHVTFAGECLQILTYARHLWPLSNGGSLACHTCDTTYRLKWSPPRTHDTNTYCRAFSSGAVATFFLRHRSVQVRIPTPNLPHCENNSLIDCASTAVQTDGKTDRQTDKVKSIYPQILFADVY